MRTSSPDSGDLPFSVSARIPARGRYAAVWLLILWVPVACRQVPGRGVTPASSGGSLPLLEDQYGRRWDGDDLLTGPTVFILGVPDTAASNTRWDNEVVAPALAGTRVAAHRALDLRGYPRLASGLIAARIREGTDPPGVAVLLDWSGELARRFDAKPDATTVLVIDGAGQERFRAHGEPHADSRESFRRAIELLHAGKAMSASARMASGT